MIDSDEGCGIKVMIIAESSHQRIAFCDTIRSCGLTLVGCMAYEQVIKKCPEPRADIWLIDSQCDDHLIELIKNTCSGQVLMGFDIAPFFTETLRYAKWQRKLKRKLAAILKRPEILVEQRSKVAARSWQFVVLIGASMGGPDAVKTFLDNLSPKLPVSILLAHHFDDKMIHALPRILNRHNNWRCNVIATTQIMQAGQCLIAPTDKKIVCASNGRIMLSCDSWEGYYRPAIGELLKNASEVFGPQLISIIFSGMGQDGAQYLKHIQNNHCQLWAQDPAVSTSASQPKAIVDSGYCQFIGSPERLADKLTKYITDQQAAV